MLTTHAQWLHQHVSPYALVALVVSAIGTQEQEWAAYPFVGLFLFLFVLWTTRMLLWVHKYDLIRPLYKWLQEKGRALSKLLFSLKDSFVFKVCVGIFLVNLCVTLPMWAYYHLDLPRFIRATVQFLADIFWSLLDVHMLILAVRTWMQKTLLAPIIDFLYATWDWEREAIRSDPVWGLFSIFILSLSLGVCVVAVKFWEKLFVSVRTVTVQDASSLPVPPAQPTRKSGRVTVTRDDE